MWDKLEYPPQPFGECSICKRHSCGEYTEDGVTKQRWLHLPIELDKGGRLVIGYQCVRGMSEDLGVAVRVVEKEIKVEPSDEQLLRVMREAIPSFHPNTPAEPGNTDYVAPEQPKTRKRGASK